MRYITAFVLCLSGLTCANVLFAQTDTKPILLQPTERKTIALGFRDWSPLAIDGNTVISGRPNSAGGLYALDATTGKPKWIYRPRNPIGANTVGIPLIVGDRVIASFNGSQGGGTIAVALATGKEIWQVSGMPQYRYDAVDGMIFAFGKDKEGVIRALDIATGQERWRVKYETVGATIPKVRDAVLYLTGSILAEGSRFAEDFLLALDARSGRELWRYHLEKGANQMIVTAGAIYLAADNYFYGVDRATGKALWKVRQLYRTLKDRAGYDKDYLYNLHNLREAGAYIVGMSSEGLIGFNKTTGENDWEIHGYFPASSASMAVAGSVLYFQGNLEAKPPAEQWAPPGGEVKLHAMDLETRKILWSFRRATNPDWSLSSLVPFDHGLWAVGFGSIIKLQ